MLIGYAMPYATNVVLAGGAGTAWLTADNGAACVDGKPGRRARFQWGQGDPSTAHAATITLEFAAAAPMRIAAVLGLRNVPAGAAIEVYGKRAADGDATYDFGGGNTGVVVQLADGSFATWFVLPAAADPVQKVRFRLVNNNGGATWATNATAVDVGELVAMPAVSIAHESDWQIEAIDPTETARSLAAQPSSVARQAYRQLTGRLSASTAAQARGGALANGMDWQRLRVAMLGDRRCAAIVRWENAGVVDVAEVHATALYGIGRIGPAAHLGGDYYGADFSFQEVPAPV